MADEDVLAAAFRALADVPEAEIKRACGLFQPLTAKKGTLLSDDTHNPQQIVFVVSGLIHLYYRCTGLYRKGRQFGSSRSCRHLWIQR